MSNENEAAFPTVHDNWLAPGLTKRELFTLVAMYGAIRNYSRGETDDGIGAAARNVADATLRALEENREQ